MSNNDSQELTGELHSRFPRPALGGRVGKQDELSGLRPRSRGATMLRLFRRRIEDEPLGSSPADITLVSQPPCTTLYVDTENLQGSAQSLVETVIGEWPEGFPPLSRLNLYVRGNQVSLWDIWASSQFPQLTVEVRGIQHFTGNHSKNSADIAIATDAVADFVMGVTQFVAVMSDDSDFMPLYAKLKDLTPAGVPFLWVMTDRTRTKAATIEEFFPNDHIHVVQIPAKHTQSQTAGSEDGESSALWLDMAELIIKKVPVGSFKSVECQPVIESRWPDHPMAQMPGQQFGVEFANKLWPVLEERGVRLLRKQPRKYEMTSEAKDTAEDAD